MPPETILVVDYEDNIRNLVVELLQGAGYEVFQTDSGEGALEMLGRLDIDLLMCNLVLPGISGVELALSAQMLRPEIRVLLTTGHVLETDQTPRIPVRNARVVNQPFRPDVLLTEIRRILKGPGPE